VSPVSMKFKKQVSPSPSPKAIKSKSSRRIINNSRSFFLSKKDESALGFSSENSSDEKSIRHPIFQKRSQRGRTKISHSGGEFVHSRCKYASRKPNSFSDFKQYQKAQKLPEQKHVSSVDSESNSNNDSAVMVPKLSRSDLASFLNEGNECSVIEEDDHNELTVDNNLENDDDKPRIWYERLHSNEMESKYKPKISCNQLDLTEKDPKSKF